MRSTRRAKRGVNTLKVKRTYGFPDRMLTKVEYRDNYRATVTGPGTYYDWRLASIYDPDRSGTGHQPFWTDQFEAVYSRYRVFAVSYEIKLVLINGNAPAECVTLASPDYGTVPSSIGQAREQDRTCNRVVPADPSVVTVLRGRISLPNLRGQTSTSFRGDDQNWASFGQNPLNDSNLRLFLTTFDGNESQFSISMKMVHHLEVYNRRNPITS